MWENIKQYIIRRLIGMQDGTLDLGRYDNIEDVDKWTNIYEGNPPWAEDAEVSNIASSIVSSISKKVTIEMESRVVDKDGEEDSVKAEYLNRQYQRLIDRTRVNVEHLLVQGGALLRPYVASNNEIVVEFILPSRFIPIRFNDIGELVEVVIIDRLNKDGKLYTKLETHILQDNGEYSIVHTFHLGEGITNAGKVSGEISSELVPDEWADVKNNREFYGVGFRSPLFAYMRNPAANNKDINSPLGVSIYSQTEKTLEAYDRLYDTYLWEFEGGELKVMGPRDFMMLMDPSLRNAHKGTLDDLSPRMTKKMKRLYMSLEMKPHEVKDPLTVFNPNLREVEINAGLERLLRTIEFDVGLGYGELSNVNEQQKTAEEIRAGKQRTHTTIVDIQKEIERAYTKVVEIMEIYLDLGPGYEKLIPEEFVDEEIELTWSFDDSIVIDRKTMLEGMLEDVKEGIIPKERYIMEKYGVSEEEARKMVIGE